MRSLSMFMLLGGLLTAIAASAATRELSIPTPDGPRHAVLAESDHPSAAPRPLVLVLHGHMGSAAGALGLKRRSPSPLAQWVKIAQRDDVLVLALDGNRGADRQQGWNDCRGDSFDNPRSDDVAFARAAVKQLVDAGQADPHRIYAMGMSNGAMMAYRLGLQMPELAAFAAVSGSMASTSQCPGAPNDRVAALIINGDQDPLVPFNGGQVHFRSGPARGGVIPVPDAFAAWAKAHHHAPADAKTLSMSPQARRDDTRAVASYFGESLATSDVAMIRVNGGGHVEPSLDWRYRALYLHFVGAQGSEFESAELAWQFFRDKRLP